MKTLVNGLSIMCLMLGLSTQALSEESKASEDTDAEVMALVNDAKAKAATQDESAPLFKAQAPVKKEKEGGLWLWMRMLGSLAIVLILFVGGFYGFKQLPGGRAIAGRNKMIQVMGQHHLGTNKSLAVIRVAGETVLIGVTSHNITLLKSLALLDEDIVSKPTNDKFTKTLAQKLTPEEDFTMSGLKDLIGNKLKGMRELS